MTPPSEIMAMGDTGVCPSFSSCQRMFFYNNQYQPECIMFAIAKLAKSLICIETSQSDVYAHI